MKYYKYAIALTSAFLPCGTVRALAEDVLTVAVFDFDSKDEAVRGYGQKISTLLNAHLSADPQIITVERAELDKALGEQELSLSGAVSAESATKVGQLTGAKVLVTGRVFSDGRDLFIVAKIIGTETSILQKCGFRVIDEKSMEKADIEISGQAFSAYGLRKGNLISCRSRIELKAHERNGGKLLYADSQTSVAFDIAEQTAAKTASENALWT